MWMMADMSNASTFANAVGRANLAKAAGVGMTAISNAVVRGWFPPSWFVAAKALADEKGVECPPELFGMKLPGAEAAQ
jgi:hydrogenase/urease accessory protein HupE